MDPRHLFLILSILSATGCLGQVPSGDESFEFYLVPQDDVAGHVKGVLDVAQYSVHAAVLDQGPKDLVAARGRGVEVMVVMRAEGTESERMRKAGVEVRVASGLEEAAVVVDGETVMTGGYLSYGNTLQVFRSKAIAQRLEGRFWKLWSKSTAGDGSITV
ncbi:MAG: hypothetical protein AABX40_05025 [Candidatus Hydrothermarchaeota archaeon]